MGQYTHHAIVCSGWPENLAPIYEKAQSIFSAAFSSIDGSKYISSLIGGQMNSLVSFLIAPDGSKEGEITSLEGDQAREEFINWIRLNAESVDWVLVQFGRDAYQVKVQEHTNSYLED